MNRSDNQALHEALSAVMDGHATPTEWARVEAAWAGDPALRERWALWQAAGDGLRSVGGQEGLLTEVRHVGGVAHAARQQAFHPALVLQHQHVEGGTAAGLGLAHQQGVGILAPDVHRGTLGAANKVARRAAH